MLARGIKIKMAVMMDMRMYPELDNDRFNSTDPPTGPDAISTVGTWPQLPQAE